MPAGWQQRWLVAAACALVSGCAGDVGVMLAELDRQRSDVELVQTPFYPQVTDQCGPSALAAVLNSSGITVSADALKSQIYIPGRQGSLQIELLAAARGFGRIPYLVDADIGALLDEVRGGRPVLVLQNLGTRVAPMWHYAVVVGYLADERQLILRSGDRERQVMSASRFVRTWKRADYWGVLVLRPGELPAAPDADRYIRSVAAIEAVGDSGNAVAGYLAATERWPEHSLGWLGLGNAHYAEGDLELAENAYARLLSAEPDHPIALNNLAQVQVDRGCFADARATLDAAAAATADTTMHRTIQAARLDLGRRNLTTACP